MLTARPEPSTQLAMFTEYRDGLNTLNLSYVQHSALWASSPNMRLSPNSDDPEAQHNVRSISSSKRVPVAPPVLCQPMRTPEQRPALEEMKAQGAIPRTHMVAWQVFRVILQLRNWSTKDSN